MSETKSLKTKSLKSMVNLANQVIEALVAREGEMTPEMETLVRELNVSIPDKIDAYVSVLERLELEESYWDRKSKMYQAVARGCKSQREYLKTVLKDALRSLDGKSVVSGIDSKISLAQAKPALIINEDELPPIYFMIKQTKEPDKEKIRRDLELGVMIPGATLKESHSLRIGINKNSAR